MKNLNLTLLLSLILSSGLTNAAITSYDERFILFCEIEGSTGFNWVNSNWKQVNFKAGEKYIIKKHDDEIGQLEDGYDRWNSKYPLCAINKQEPTDDFWGFNRDGCYSVTRFGEESNRLDAKLCRETWDENEQGEYALESLQCNVHFNFMKLKPNGLIHIFKNGSLDSDPKELIVNGESIFPAGYKDSMYIAFGRCSTI